VAIRFLEIVQTGRYLQVRREIDQPDGTVLEDVHAFPIETMALRAGEYGVSVTDTDALLDIVTYESLPEFPQPELGPFPALVAEPTLEAGRRRHLDRVAAVKAAHDGRSPRQNGVAKRAADTRHADVRAAIVRASDLDPELAELAGADLERRLPAARRVYARAMAEQAALAAMEAAPNGDGTSTMKAALRARLERAKGPTVHGRQ
jgi:hypothetical protein